MGRYKWADSNRQIERGRFELRRIEATKVLYEEEHH
jgi:hypothetical protein